MACVDSCIVSVFTGADGAYVASPSGYGTCQHGISINTCYTNIVQLLAACDGDVVGGCIQDGEGCTGGCPGLSAEMSLVSSTGTIDVSGYPFITGAADSSGNVTCSVYYHWRGGPCLSCPGGCSSALAPFNIVFTISFTDAVPPCSGGGGMSVFSKLNRFTDFGFDIPLNASVSGISVTIDRNAETYDISDSIVKIMKDHKIIGDNKSELDFEWDLGRSEHNYGGLDDLWGLGIAPSDINQEGFGIAIEVENASEGIASKAEINYIVITVYYIVDNNLSSQTKTQDFDGAVYPLF